MSLDLDDRQRAMLREMGVHVWQPAAPVPPTADAGAENAPENRASHAIDTRARGLNGLKNPEINPTPAVAQALAPHTASSGPDRAFAAGLAGAALPVRPAAPDVAAATTTAQAATAIPAGVVPDTAAQSLVPATAAQPPMPATAAPSPVAGRRTPPLVAPAASPTTVKDLPAGIAAMTWPQLQDTVAHCQACAMCFGRRAPVLAAPDDVTPCDWLVLGDPPDEAQERLGLPFVEEAGLLLDNMLRAVGVTRFVPDAASGGAPDPGATPVLSVPASRAYLTHVLKCRPALMRAPNTTELATCANYLRREIALTQPKVILAMGRFAMQLLLSETPPESAKLPLGKLRGQVWQFAGVPVVVTYPPAYLLRSGQDKGKAWADLCLALDVAQGTWPG